MKRGFLKNGLSGKIEETDMSSKGSPSERKSGTATTVSTGRPASTADGPPRTNTTVSDTDKAKSPTGLTLDGKRPDLSHPSHPVHHLGEGITRVKFDPATDNRRHYIERFGGPEGADVWDTAVITREDNYELINGHRGYRSSITSRLAARNSLSVEVGQLSGDRGLGLLAKKDISAGELVIQERPLLIMTRTLDTGVMANLETMLEKTMCPPRQAAYYRLYNCYPKGPQRMGALSIARTNGLGVDLPKESDDDHLCVCDLISRANHDCTPNAQFNFNYVTFCGELISIMPIKAGSEITIRYTDPFQSARERNAELQKAWNFACLCAACDPSAPSFTQLERERKFLNAVLKRAERQASPSYSKKQDLLSDDEIAEILATIDSTRLFDLRHKFLEMCAFAEAIHMEETHKYERAAVLAARALNELQKSGMQHANEEMKKCMDMVISNARRHMAKSNNSTRNTHPEPSDSDQLKEDLRGGQRPQARKARVEQQANKMMEEFKDKMLRSSMAEQQDMINDFQSLWKDAGQSRDPSLLDQDRVAEVMKKHLGK